MLSCGGMFCEHRPSCPYQANLCSWESSRYDEWVDFKLTEAVSANFVVLNVDVLVQVCARAGLFYSLFYVVWIVPVDSTFCFISVVSRSMQHSPFDAMSAATSKFSVYSSRCRCQRHLQRAWCQLCCLLWYVSQFFEDHIACS